MVACIPKKHRAAFNFTTFLHETVLILLFSQDHNVFLLFDIAQVKSRFTRESLVTSVSLVHLTVACVPLQHRAAFKMRPFLHESVFILLFIDSDNVFLHLDIAQTKTRFTQEPLVTTVSSVNLKVACEKHRAAFIEVLPPRERLHPPLHTRSQCVSSTLSSPRAKHASRGNRLSQMFLW